MYSYFLLSLQADTLLLRVEVSGFTVNYYVCTFQSNMSAYSHTLLGKERRFFFSPQSTPLNGLPAYSSSVSPRVGFYRTLG